ncbi:unnamed protein product [Hymenolepis diminuta]|uniref:BSD domain-containing protein n=1 Tax=Hymenolepis diminuta TaxID=6216 RepID=A0A0R3SD13_HYMDI|nr:unnamed protein product [Hymenolepis diminuta]
MDTNIAEVSPSESGPKPVLPEPQETNYLGWFKLTLSQSADVWNSIKRDINEVAQSVATSDSLNAAKGTASSVYRQFSNAVQSLQQEGAKAEPLPEESTSSSGNFFMHAYCYLNAPFFVLIDYPTGDVDFSAQFTHLKSSFTGIVNALERGISELTGGNFNFNFGSSESGISGDNREARIEVIRADPATYEQTPSTTQKDILSYSAWRDAYFDENTYCPHPGIPVFEGESIPEESNFNATITYPSPAQVLEESPVIRSHLLRLVDPDGGNNCGIQECDFWSRYYYRVWCLDVLELRRSRLSKVNVGGDRKNSEMEELDSADAWPELEEKEVKSEEGSNAKVESSTIAGKETKEKPEESEDSQLVPKGTETVLSSPASSVVLVTKEDISGSSEENDENQSNGDEEDLTQQEPRGNADRLLFISCENSCLILFYFTTR